MALEGAVKPVGGGEQTGLVPRRSTPTGRGGSPSRPLAVGVTNILGRNYALQEECTRSQLMLLGDFLQQFDVIEELAYPLHDRVQGGFGE
jgi:hypothetical protein